MRSVDQDHPRPMVICPIRYDGGARSDDRELWVELRRLFAHNPTQLMGFVTACGASYWMDLFTPLLPSLERREAVS